jgi:hypothetical protein
MIGISGNYTLKHVNDMRLKIVAKSYNRKKMGCYANSPNQNIYRDVLREVVNRSQ